MSSHNLCFEQKYEKYQSFLSENFQFLELKFSIYLNWCVFVMKPYWNEHLSWVCTVGLSYEQLKQGLHCECLLNHVCFNI